MKLIRLTAAFILCIYGKSALAGLEALKWKLYSDKDGIQVYIPDSYKHPSGLTPIRFKAQLSYSTEKVIQVLSNEKLKTQWVPKLKEAKVVSRTSAYEYVMYYRYDAPWPFDDRDFVIKHIVTPEVYHSKINVVIKSVDINQEFDESAVRGITYEGYSVIRSIDRHRTSLELAFINDFGGNIPTWIINFVQKKWPHRFVDNLNKQLSKKFKKNRESLKSEK